MANAPISIGDIQISRVYELDLPLAIADFYPDVPAEAWDKHLDWLVAERAYDQASASVVLPVQGYLVRTAHHTILIDSCVGNHKTSSMAAFNGRSDPAFTNNLAALGVATGDIDMVMCSHLHSDHVGWNTQLVDGRWVPTFENATYLFEKNEVAVASAAEPLQPAYRESVLPIIEAGQAQIVAGDHAIDDQVWLESTPGHTPGHFSVRLSSGGQNAVIAGDVMHSPVQCREPQWAVSSDWDPAMARATRQAFLERHCEAGTQVAMAHFPLPSFGRFEPHDDAFWFVYDDRVW